MSDMAYRPLGDSGLVVSVVGLGCNNLGRAKTRTETLEGTRKVIDAAFDAGITLFDVADIYGAEPGLSEDLLGQCLAGRRDDVVVATKFGMDMRGANGPDFGARGSRRYIRRAVEASLRRLRTDHIDLYQYHAPDGVTPIEETLAALDELVREGKVRYIGSSNFAGWQVVEADYVARAAGGARFISAQNYYNLLHRDPEAELIPACQAYGVGMLPFFPLESGLLTGKYRRDEEPPAGTRIGDSRRSMHADADWDTIEAIREFADQRGVSMLNVAIGGLAAQPAVASVIAGATSPEQIRTNVEAAQWIPSDDDLRKLAEITG
ncbi:aldo/keto reductase [Actinoallomurus rhizosphaericola]|uniref:aldo/keto reductase n=1 Tax=Actinoallomurus rhizosphaericola TaxID=2952536 RepID=UPI00209353BF|nr:aldo/keto reductase [Actinoallomurus rhizosphaericola]MCO5998522.1 aldo/keto reductase [Actinoallomurus rhizosphaericola]